jgi:LAO/AO transport system kinase
MNEIIQNIFSNIHYSSPKTIARAISIVESELEGFEDLLKNIQPKNIPVVGFTGPPGAGKSTLINALLEKLSKEEKKIAVVAVDPTSPFTQGSLLGDRVRMSKHFSDPNIYIRSLATRGSLGGLSAKSIEVTDVLKAAGFDYIFIETVGVGQSEVEIAGLADVVVLVLVPEGGDEVQFIKSGIMEIGDVFAVNKSDRPGAETFAGVLKNLLHQQKMKSPPVVLTVASENKGIEELWVNIDAALQEISPERKTKLVVEKSYQLIMKGKMRGLSKQKIAAEMEKEMMHPDFNLYRFVERFF